MGDFPSTCGVKGSKGRNKEIEVLDLTPVLLNHMTLHDSSLVFIQLVHSSHYSESHCCGGEMSEAAPARRSLWSAARAVARERKGKMFQRVGSQQPGVLAEEGT